MEQLGVYIQRCSCNWISWIVANGWMRSTLKIDDSSWVGILTHSILTGFFCGHSKLLGAYYNRHGGAPAVWPGISEAIWPRSNQPRTLGVLSHIFGRLFSYLKTSDYISYIYSWSGRRNAYCCRLSATSFFHILTYPNESIISNCSYQPCTVTEGNGSSARCSLSSSTCPSLNYCNGHIFYIFWDDCTDPSWTF